MFNCQTRFRYNQEETIIDCQRNDLLKDIITLYETKSQLPADQFSYFYNGNKINPDLTFAQLNDKDSEIIINVFPKENEIKKSDFIKCAKCIKPAIVEFFNDYWIALSDEKHGQKKIKLQDYNKTQMIDQSKIKCSKCSNSINICKNKFYYCFECNKNFCLKCKSLHKEHKNIVNYSLKFFKCPQHQNQNFTSYCFDCKKNLCLLCEEQHKKHNIIIFSNLFQKQNKELIKKIKKATKLVDNIIDSLQNLSKI